MYHKRVFLFLLFLILSLRTFSAVFVVTSKADSGPGTLREALTLAAANGSATKDYINFNLPDLSIGGRTITLMSQLPYVSSNLAIDGTTQPGPNLGRSTAKITLQPKNGSIAFNALVLLDTDGFELYGLYIRDFNAPIYYSDDQGVPNTATAIYLETSTDVQIGAPGKGNVFANDGFVETCSGTSLKDRQSGVLFSVKNLKFYSNIVGFEPDGKTYRGTQTWYNGGGLQINYCWGDIRIGDDNVETRNFFGNGAAILNSASRSSLHESSILIKNNYFSYDIDGNPSAIVNINADDIFVVLMAGYSPVDPLTYPYTVNIIDNKFQWPYTISCGHISGDFTMQGNKLLFEPSVVHPAYAEGIGAYSDGNILIGGENPGEANVLFGEEIDLFSRKSVLLQRNSIYCVSDFRGIWYPNVAYLDPPLPLPVVSINKIALSSISGTATPLSKVELFWDDDCSYCEPLTYVTTVKADAAGNWQYNGIVKGGVIASATLNGFTSLFTKHPALNTATVKHTTCGGNNGAITDVQVFNSGGYSWKNENNEIVGTTADIHNLPPGKYTLTGLNGSCSRDYTFEIFDATPKINSDNIQIVQPSCNSTGSVKSLYLQNYEVLQADYSAYSFKWTDASGKIVSTDIELTDAEVGTYTLEVTYKNQCPVTYGPVVLKNTTGPNINQAAAKIQSTNCGQSTGSITNISATGSGTLKYRWTNDRQQEVGTNKDLLNQPAGTYKLQVTDDTQCGPIYTTDIVIPETNGITLDESKVQTTIASCSQHNGSITGIKFTGATQYEWLDANNHVVSTDADFKNAASGDYTFTASNNFGCSKTSKVYHVDLQAPTQFPQYAAAIVPSCFGNNNGSVSVSTDGLAKSMRWVNSQGVTVGGQPALTNVSPGTYQLYLTDQNGCENYYNAYTVDELAEYKVASTGEIVNDQCGLKIGSISNINITGGVPPYTYKWTNANNEVVGETNSITNLAAGKYVLNVVDTRCGNVDIPYTITDESADVVAPSVSDLQLCSSGSALLIVNNAASSVTYRLYDAQSSVHPIDEQKGGKFNITVNANRSYFVSQLNGTCESSRAEVKIAVGLSVVNIANTFTPNGDGINDYWKITSIENYPDAIVQVFSRYGQKVYESKGYGTPFEGNLNGKKLPAGVYYYIINLKTNCNILRGSLTVIR